MTNLALSWDATKDHDNRPNERVSMDWGIINKQYIKDKKNVFALYLDNNTGLVFGYPADSTGQAGLSLSAYIQRYGTPKIIVHDNAKEFIHGEFAQICEDKSTQQIRSPPFTPNENPTEHYMEVIHYLNNALPTLHLWPRPCSILGTCFTTRSQLTTKNSTTWAMHSI